MQRVAEQVQDHFARGDWPAGVREGLAEFTRELGRFGRAAEPGAGSRTDTDSGARTTAGTEPGSGTDHDSGTAPGSGTGTAPGSGTETTAGTDTTAPVDLGKGDGRPAPEPEWAHEEPSGNPARDLDRLLDRFRDDIRDAARDHGVTDSQLRDARRHLSAAAAHIGAALRDPGA